MDKFFIFVWGRRSSANVFVFYTFEFGAEVILDPKDDIEVVKEKLWNDCHSEVDKQISDVVSPKKND